MRKHKSDRIIGILTLVLMILGLIVIYAIGPMRANYMNAAYGTNYGENSFFVHQLISVGVSVVAFFVAFLLPYEKIRKFALLLLVFGILSSALLAILAAAGNETIAICTNGACRWIRVVGPISFQPAEVLKLGLVLYLAQLAAKRRTEKKLETSDFWLPFLVMSGLSILFVVYFQQDLGTTVVLVMIMLGILC